MKNSVLFVFALFSIVFYACRNDKEELVVKGQEYFPTKIGTKHLYKVDTVFYDLFQKKIDTFSNQFQEEVVEKFTNLSGDTIYRIELSKFNSDKGMFVPFMSFERKVVGNYAIETLNNGVEVKMLFPISTYKTKGTTYSWNLNMFNSREPKIVKYSSVFTGYNNGLNNFSNCVSIKLTKPTTGIINTVREEVYSKNIGLVYRFTDSTDYLQNDTFPSGKKIFVRLIN